MDRKKPAKDIAFDKERNTFRKKSENWKDKYQIKILKLTN